MTASPDQYPADAVGWFLHTTDGLICSGPHPSEAAARTAGNQHAAELRERMRAERYSEERIQDRVEALRVSFGRRARPHGWFEAG